MTKGALRMIAGRGTKFKTGRKRPKNGVESKSTDQEDTEKNERTKCESHRIRVVNLVKSKHSLARPRTSGSATRDGPIPATCFLLIILLSPEASQLCHAQSASVRSSISPQLVLESEGRDNNATMMTQRNFLDPRHNQLGDKLHLRKLLARPKLLLSAFVPHLLNKQMVLKRPTGTLALLSSNLKRLHEKLKHAPSQFNSPLIAFTSPSLQPFPMSVGLHDHQGPQQAAMEMVGPVDLEARIPQQIFLVQSMPSNRVQRHNLQVDRPAGDPNSGTNFDEPRSPPGAETEHGLNQMDHLIRSEYESRLNLNEQLRMVSANESSEDSNPGDGSGRQTIEVNAMAPERQNVIVIEAREPQQERQRPATGATVNLIHDSGHPSSSGDLWRPAIDHQATSTLEATKTATDYSGEGQDGDDELADPNIMQTSLRNNNHREHQDTNENMRAGGEREPEPGAYLLSEPSSSRLDNNKGDKGNESSSGAASAAKQQLQQQPFIPTAFETIAHLRLNTSVAGGQPASEMVGQQENNVGEFIAASNNKSASANGHFNHRRQQRQHQQQVPTISDNADDHLVKHHQRQLKLRQADSSWMPGGRERPAMLISAGPVNGFRNRHHSISSPDLPSDDNGGRPSSIARPLVNRQHFSGKPQQQDQDLTATRSHIQLVNGDDMLLVQFRAPPFPPVGINHAHQHRAAASQTNNIIDMTAALSSDQRNHILHNHATARQQTTTPTDAIMAPITTDSLSSPSSATAPPPLSSSVSFNAGSPPEAPSLDETLRRLRETKARIQQLQAELNATHPELFLMTEPNMMPANIHQPPTLAPFLNRTRTRQQSGDDEVSGTRTTSGEVTTIAAYMRPQPPPRTLPQTGSSSDWFRIWSPPENEQGRAANSSLPQAKFSTNKARGRPITRTQDALNIPLGMYHGGGPVTAPARLVASALGRVAHKAAGFTSMAQHPFPVNQQYLAGRGNLMGLHQFLIKPSSAPILVSSTITVSSGDGQQSETTLRPIDGERLQTAVKGNSTTATSPPTRAHEMDDPFRLAATLKKSANHQHLKAIGSGGGGSAATFNKPSDGLNATQADSETDDSGATDDDRLDDDISSQVSHSPTTRTASGGNRKRNNGRRVTASSMADKYAKDKAAGELSESSKDTKMVQSESENGNSAEDDANDGGEGEEGTGNKGGKQNSKAALGGKDDNSNKSFVGANSKLAANGDQVSRKRANGKVAATNSTIRSSGSNKLSSQQAGSDASDSNATLRYLQPSDFLRGKQTAQGLAKASNSSASFGDGAHESNKNHGGNFISQLFARLLDNLVAPSNVSSSYQAEVVGSETGNLSRSISSYLAPPDTSRIEGNHGSHSKLTTERVLHALILFSCSLALICLVIVYATYRCSSRRFSSKGETAISVSSNGTATSPVASLGNQPLVDWRKFAGLRSEAQNPHRKQLILEGTMRNVSLLSRQLQSPPASTNEATGHDYRAVGLAPMLNRSCCHCVHCAESKLFRDDDNQDDDDEGGGSDQQQRCPSGYYHPVPRGRLPFGAASSVNKLLDHNQSPRQQQRSIQHAENQQSNQRISQPGRLLRGGTRMRMMSAIDESFGSIAGSSTRLQRGAGSQSPGSEYGEGTCICQQNCEPEASELPGCKHQDHDPHNCHHQSTIKRIKCTTATHSARGDSTNERLDQASNHCNCCDTSGKNDLNLTRKQSINCGAISGTNCDPKTASAKLLICNINNNQRISRGNSKVAGGSSRAKSASNHQHHHMHRTQGVSNEEGADEDDDEEANRRCKLTPSSGRTESRQTTNSNHIHQQYRSSSGEGPPPANPTATSEVVVIKQVSGAHLGSMQATNCCPHEGPGIKVAGQQKLVASSKGETTKHLMPRSLAASIKGKLRQKIIGSPAPSDGDEQL